MHDREDSRRIFLILFIVVFQFERINFKIKVKREIGRFFFDTFDQIDKKFLMITKRDWIEYDLKMIVVILHFIYVKI